MTTTPQILLIHNKKVVDIHPEISKTFNTKKLYKWLQYGETNTTNIVYICYCISLWLGLMLAETNVNPNQAEGIKHPTLLEKILFYLLS